MDLDRPVTYRGLPLNTVGMTVGETLRFGCVLEEADFGDVMGVGYVEKRAQGDGNDASDVYLSARQVRLTGFIYGRTKAETFDRLQDLRSAFTPTSAYLESPGQRGYLPLEFDVPTEDELNFPGHWKLMVMYARPRAQPQFKIRRDTGSQANGPLTFKGSGIGWSGLLECKDPRIYLRDPHWEYFVGSESGTLPNRGDYPAPADVLLDVAAGAALGTVTIKIGTTTAIIHVAASASAQVYRYSSTHKVLTVETNSVEVLRMDLLELEENGVHLLVPPGNEPYTITKVGTFTLTANTRLMYNEAFA
jgi:hypothetical protein